MKKRVTVLMETFLFDHLWRENDGFDHSNFCAVEFFLKFITIPFAKRGDSLLGTKFVYA